MRTYICLYLVSPMINHFLKDAGLSRRLYLLMTLGFIGVYLGMMAQSDSALHNFCNLTIFMFLYVVGETLHEYEYLWRRIMLRYLITSFLLLNITLVVVFCIFNGTLVSKAVFWLSFPYNSILMQVNAVLLLMIVVKHPFKSKAVNWLSASSLAIYLIHGSPLMRRYVYAPLCQNMLAAIDNEYVMFVALFVPAIITLFACIFIDKLFTPLWRIFRKGGDRTQQKLENYIRESKIMQKITYKITT